MSRFSKLSGLLLAAAQHSSKSWSTCGQSLQPLQQPSVVVPSCLHMNFSHYFTSTSLHQEAAKEVGAPTATSIAKPEDKYKHLLDKDIWDEAWAYEPRFGTETSPIVVPSLEAQRIIGVTDPHDDTLVIWGIIREDEPPRQLVHEGEFFVLKKVDHVDKVGEVLGLEQLP